MRGFLDWLAREERIGRALIAFMAAGLLALLAVLLTAVRITRTAQDDTAAVNHTYEVSLAIAAAETLIERTETSRRGYLLAGEDRYLEVYDDGRRALGPAIDRIAALTHDNPRQESRVDAVKSLLLALHERRAVTIRLRRMGNASGAQATFVAEANAARLRQIRDLLGDMIAEERTLLAERGAAQAGIVRAFYAILAVAGLILLLVAVIALLAARRYTRDIGASRDRLRELNDTLEAQVAERTADLTRANDEIQRFAYIVSHDLRSPLVNVMGFTAELSTVGAVLGELVDRAEAEAPHLLTPDARLAVREDLPEAIDFIRTSTAKMDRLINAILTLSRQGRRTLSPEPLDLAGLCGTIVDSMRQVIDARGVDLVIETPMPPIVSDRLAVEQILSNLVENATKYLQPGRPGRVAVSATRVGPRIVIAVADNGRGVDPRDHERIFDLFRRSGQQDQPGEGIGLAHVRALAYRLGGTVTIRSTLGEGATFYLSLPSTPPKQELAA
jgi:signal transduction histidine kinase